MPIDGDGHYVPLDELVRRNTIVKKKKEFLPSVVDNDFPLKIVIPHTLIDKTDNRRFLFPNSIN